MNVEEFQTVFKELTGNLPLSWQERLYRDHFAPDAPHDLPHVIDLPTGLGKTMVMAIWLIACAENKKLPRRLIYVVDRRTVVDQASDLAKKLRDNADTALHFSDLAISTLRGQLADNRNWSRDPSRPAIIIGTVDLIGSGLLFSGYRSGYKTKPLHAGLLGQDSLLVLDEAHLSKPFEKLIMSISSFQSGQGSPMKVIRMSATTAGEDTNRFELEKSDLVRKIPGQDGNQVRNPIVERYEANKTLTLTITGDVIDAIAIASGQLAKSHAGSRVVIFVKSPKDVDLVRKALIKKDKTCETKIAMLTGTMRGLERDELVTPPNDETQHERRVMQRFLKPDSDSSEGECFLIATSAGEVGFDLNADHMVCDAAPLDSMIQRLGRVNRRGKGNATIHLILAKEPTDKSDMDKACIAASKLVTHGMGVSPKELAAFKSTLSSAALKAASTPEPTMIDLTDILIDTWSMTSITAPMPGRPEVAPWIRGVEEEQAQTTIAWRAEVDLVRDCPNPAKALGKIFAKHPIRPHESLTVNTRYFLEFLKQIPKLKDRPTGLMNTQVVLRLPRGRVVLRTLQQLSDDPGILYSQPALILPATFGGLAKGMLDAEAIPKARKPDDPEPTSFDVADQPSYESQPDAPARIRILIEKTSNGCWKPMSLDRSAVPDGLNVDDEYPTTRKLFDALGRNTHRVRLVQPLKADEEGEDIQAFVCLRPAPKEKDKEDQLLTKHVGAVEAQALRIADELKLGNNDPFRNALLFAARWHDEGKKADIWQNFVYGTDLTNPLGKAARTRDPKSLRGYRHEFGSLLRIHHPDRHNTQDCTFPVDSQTRELALHLIATHHGFGRPHFDNTFVREFTDGERNAIYTNSIRRFARLQRTYGHWRLAWLENLLRCADALASADQEAEDDVTDESSDSVGGAQ